MRTLALREVQKTSSGFDEEAFRALLDLYHDVQETEHEPLVVDSLVTEAIPIIGEALSCYPADIDEVVKDEMVQVSAIAVLDAIRKGLVDVDKNPHSYLRQRCRWRMLTVLQRDGPQEFDLGGRHVTFSSWIATLPGQAEVDMRLFLHQLQRIAVEEVRRRCRFRGQAYDACIYIAERLIADQVADLDWLRARKLTNPKFYVDYVRVLLGEFLRDFYHRHRPIFPETYWFQETWVAAFFAG